MGRDNAIQIIPRSIDDYEIVVTVFVIFTSIENGEIIMNPLYVFEEDENSTMDKVSGSLNRTKNPMKNDFKLRLAGIKTVI